LIGKLCCKPPARFAVPSPEFVDWSSPGGQPMTQACQQQFAAAVERLMQCGGQQVIGREGGRGRVAVRRPLLAAQLKPAVMSKAAC
jgi:hypothetical protein